MQECSRVFFIAPRILKGHTVNDMPAFLVKSLHHSGLVSILNGFRKESFDDMEEGNTGVGAHPPIGRWPPVVYRRRSSRSARASVTVFCDFFSVRQLNEKCKWKCVYTAKTWSLKTTARRSSDTGAMFRRTGKGWVRRADKKSG